MKTGLVNNLEQLRKEKVIKGYSLNTYEEDGKYGKKDAYISLSINNKPLVKSAMSYDPAKTKFSRVSDILLERLHNQLLAAGVMALYTNVNDRVDGPSKDASIVINPEPGYYGC